MMKQPIRNLADLEREQNRLHLEMEITKQAFRDSLARTRKHSVDYVIHKAIVPIGMTAAAGVAAWGTKKVVEAIVHHNAGDDHEKESEHQAHQAYEHHGANTNKWIWLQQLMPLIISLINTFILKKFNQKAEEVHEEAEKAEAAA